jgi:signal transduction histidine kinase
LKLLNHTLSYLSVALLAIIGVWAMIFYMNMLDEIYDSIDDGLANSKILIIDKVKTDSSLIHKTDFMEGNYAIHEIHETRALDFRDVYFDSTLFMQNESEYEPVRILKTAFRGPSGKFYQLEIVSSMVEEDDLIEDLLYAIIWLYLILIASILIVNNVLLRRIWKPFYGILARLKKFTLGSEHDFPNTKTNVDEFNDLNETVTDLLQRTVDTFNSQKQFIENAAHELQTPLAIGINKLELLTERNSLTDEQMTEISAVIESLERLTRLNRTLLLLSKIENRQFTDESLVNVNEIVERTVHAFSDLSEFKSVTVEFIQESPLNVRMNAELAEMMVSNLLKNAIVHNREGGTIQLKVSASAFTVTNSSDAAKLDETQIFKRFYKGSSSKSSSGLGLAIVKSIALLYDFRLAYSFDGNHTFSMHFSKSDFNLS